jgi:NADPH2:quinone reductase
VLIDVTAVGVNWADTHVTDKSYPLQADLPLVPGGEFVGFTPEGRRVVALTATGGYAERALADPRHMWEVPDEIEDAEALALVLQGTTAWHLLRGTARLIEGESVVVHAAAGGVGTIAVQLAKRFGAGRVIGVVSGDDKRDLALRLGADAVVDPDPDQLPDAIRTANRGRQADVILEMVGGRTFEKSLDALAPFGRLVHYGQAGRKPPPPVDPTRLMVFNQAVVGFWLFALLETPELIAGPLEELFRMVAAGELEVVVGRRYPLALARQAHEDMRTRKTWGKLVLDV